MKLYKQLKNHVLERIKKKRGYLPYVVAKNKYGKAFGGISSDSAYVLKKGNRKGNIYYIIRCSYPLIGIGTVFKHISLLNREALYLGMPSNRIKVVIDYGKYDKLLNDNYVASFGTTNIWNYWFSSTTDINCLNTILKENDTVIASPINEIGPIEDIPGVENAKQGNDIFFGGMDNSFFSKRLRDNIKGTFSLKPEIKASFHKEMENIGFNTNTLGVLMREEFTEEHLKYVKDEEHLRVLDNHPRFPNVDETIAIAKERFDEWGCSKVFVSTVYDTTVQKFLNEFGEDKVCYVKRKRSDSICKDHLDDLVKNGNCSFEAIKNSNMELFNMDLFIERYSSYLEELYILSNCRCFISGQSGGSAAVLLLQEKEFESVTWLKAEGTLC